MPKFLMQLEGELWDAVEKERGDVQRVPWIRRVVKEHLTMRCRFARCTFTSIGPKQCPDHGCFTQKIDPEDFNYLR